MQRQKWKTKSLITYGKKSTAWQVEHIAQQIVSMHFFNTACTNIVEVDMLYHLQALDRFRSARM